MTRTVSLFTTFLLTSLMFFSCNQTSESSTDNRNPKPDMTDVKVPEKPLDPPMDTIPTTPPTVDVAVYVEYPEAIDGCACYFGRNAAELSEAKYIFMTNYEKKAYMELDGEMRTFELISSTDLEDGTVEETWGNVNYDMVVRSKETESIDETSQSIGTISITPKGKGITVMNVVGECGC